MKTCLLSALMAVVLLIMPAAGFGQLADPSFTVDIVALQSSYTNVGDQLSFDIAVENTGNISLSQVHVKDGLSGESWIIDLEPGEQKVFPILYLVQQADLDKGSVEDTATAELDDIIHTDNAIVFADQEPSLVIAKTANKETFNIVGEEIIYTIVVSNTGNVILSDVVVEDRNTGLIAPIGSLSPGESQTFTETYITTLADKDYAAVVNTAKVSGKDPDSNTLTSYSRVRVTTNQNPAIRIDKTADATHFSHVGELITYTLVVTNTGDVTIVNLDVLDPLTDFEFRVKNLGPDDFLVFEVPYHITRADMNAGSVTNVASVSGGSFYCFYRADDNDSVTIVSDQVAGLTLTKTADQSTYSLVGEVITYTVTVTNSGTVSISDLVVEDPLTGLSAGIESLEPGQSRTFTETYVITQEDLDAGSVVNVVQAEGQSPWLSTVSGEDEVVVEAEQHPELVLSKIADTDSFSTVGEVITYTIVVTNTGNVTLTGIVVEDPLTGLAETIESLIPGESQTFFQSYVVKQTDLDAGLVSNFAASTGTDPNANPVSGDDSVEVDGEQNPGLTLTKTSDTDTFSATGDVITYTLVVTNTGNVTLTDVLVEDPLTGLSETIESLAPDASQIFTVTYDITQTDIDNRMVINAAMARGRDPNQEDVEGGDEVIVDLLTVELDITKSASSPEVYVGDEVTYTMVVSNNNLVAALGVVVTDVLPEGIAFVSASNGGTYDALTNTVSWILGDLAADGSITLTMVARVDSDVPAGTVITNFAVADNDNADFPSESNPAPITVIARADLMIMKGADVGSAYNGESITYTLTVTNLGPSAADNVVISDLLPPQVDFVSASDGGTYHADNHSVSWTLPDMASQATLTLTIEVVVRLDVVAGTTITNFASVTSDTEDPDLDNNEASVSVDGSGPQADVEVVKSVDGGTAYAGENYSYTITVTNNGPSQANNIEVVDIIPTQVSFVSAGQNGTYNAANRSVTWNIASLDAGQSLSFSITLYIASDVRGGTMLVNQVSANADTFDPDLENNTYTDQTPVTTPELFIPDVFSPNLDGINDRWIIRGLDRYPNNKVVIINRWGNRVFEAAPYNNDWDGTNQFSPTLGGDELPIGTYYYILDLGSDDVRRGFIYLTR